MTQSYFARIDVVGEGLLPGGVRHYGSSRFSSRADCEAFVEAYTEGVTVEFSFRIIPSKLPPEIPLVNVEVE